MSTVKEIQPNIRCIEYRQEPTDEHYGSCLYARFYFNLDRYELTIVSDCGSYGYKWVEATKESFLHLMARCDGDYIINKIYGHADVFDFDSTLKNFLDMVDDSDKAKYVEFFNEYAGADTARDFVDTVQEEWPNEFDSCDLWYSCIEYMLPADVRKIGQIFDDFIRPYIKENLLSVETISA